MKTAIIMSSMPKIPLIVEVSWKTTIPIKTAVNGSIAPKIEVNVGPICLIALTKAILEIAVAGKARPRPYLSLGFYPDAFCKAPADNEKQCP